MTVREYLTQKLSAFGTVTEADLEDIALDGDLTLDDDYTSDNASAVGAAIASFIVGKALSCCVSSVNENGFSVSWDWSGLGRYYLWLCRKWGLDIDSDTLALLGIPVIIDKTDSW